ncbi:uncharacterized protein [Clytia hemisphaerica]|uniref:SGNH hydrolase-type esterase domain-containing protein n=1 Tax=Clytia hemisphaerica TaxID=252671 RepID=A0A7M5X6E1_9CNID
MSRLRFLIYLIIYFIQLRKGRLSSDKAVDASDTPEVTRNNQNEAPATRRTHQHQMPFRKTFDQQSMNITSQYPPPIPPRDPQTVTSFPLHQFPSTTGADAYTTTSINNNNEIIKILAFGDSITEGMVNYGDEPFAPYTTKLEELLNSNSNDNGKSYFVVNEGISGECVHGEMTFRLPYALHAHSAYLKLVIILGGTNDLMKVDCDKKVNLTAEIIHLHQMAHQKGYKTVVVTIPQTGLTESAHLITSFGTFQRLWHITNARLRNYAKENSHLTILCDLAKEFPMSSLKSNHLENYWSDDLHPSAKGYEKIAELLYQTIASLDL